MHRGFTRAIPAGDAAAAVDRRPHRRINRRRLAAASVMHLLHQHLRRRLAGVDDQEPRYVERAHHGVDRGLAPLAPQFAMLQRVGVGCVGGEPMHRAAESFPVLPQERDALDENLAAVRARHHARGEVREGPEVVRAASLQERLAEAVVSVGYPHRHP